MNNKQLQKFILGLAFVIISVKILKRILRKPRPVMNERDTFGMPSTRAASLFYILFFIILNTSGITKKTITILIVTILFCCSIKFFMKEHTLSQLSVGAILGTTIAYVNTNLI